jgi:hypothetical protein
MSVNLQALIDKAVPRRAYAPRPDSVTSRRLALEAERKRQAEEEAKRRAEARLRRAVRSVSEEIVSDKPTTEGPSAQSMVPMPKFEEPLFKISVASLKQIGAEVMQVRIADFESPCRARAVARPRQVAMYLTKHLTTLSLPQIGRHFGKRDHTTVMHAMNKITTILEGNSDERDKVEGWISTITRRFEALASKLATPDRDCDTTVQREDSLLASV